MMAGMDPKPSDIVVAGADGCRAGWFVVMRHLATGTVEHHTVPTFAALLDLCAEVSAVGLDMPIGLMDMVERGGRPPDRLARERLKPHRSSSIFSPPCRAALACATYEEAAAATRARSSTGGSLTLQSFGLFPKLREVDALMTADWQRLVHEVHPELSFATMNGDRPLEVSKQKPGGQALRIEVLLAAGFDISAKSVKRLARAGVGRSDVLDAYAVCWTAGRIASGVAERLSGHPAVDSRGLKMELWV